MGNLIKNGKQDCSLPTPADKPDLDDAWRRGGGEGGTFPMFLREKFIRTQERKKIVTVLKYCLNIAKDTYLGSKQLSMPIIWSCHVTSEFLIDSL